MSRRVYEDADLTTQAIWGCVGALVVTKLVTVLKLKQPTTPGGDWEHACLATILGTESSDVRHCLSQPGTVELVNMASIAFSDVGGSLSTTGMSPDACDLLQQTLGILSEPLLAAQENAEPVQNARNNISDDWFKHTIVSGLHDFLKIYTQGASPLKEEVRLSCLRMSLRALWSCSKAYHQTADPTPDPLPSYLHLLVHASPEITHHLQTEQDPVIHFIGRCFGALIVSKLVNNLPPKIPVSLVDDAVSPYISTILGDEHREGVLHLPYQLHVINIRNVVSLMEGQIDALFPAAEMPAGLMAMAEQTLTILAERFKMTNPRFIPVPVKVQRGWLGQIPIVTNAGRPYRHKNQLVETLKELQQIMEKILPTKE